MTATTTTTPIGRGDQMPDVRGVGSNGEPTRLRDLHYMRHNVALLVVADDEQGREWLASAETRVDAAAAEHGRMVVLSPDAVASNLPLIHDAGCESLARLGISTADLPAMYVTDRYGQVFASSHGPHGIADLTPSDIPHWLQFVDCRCS